MAKQGYSGPPPEGTIDHDSSEYRAFRQKLLGKLRADKVTIDELRYGLEGILREGNAEQVRLAHLFIFDTTLSEGIRNEIRSLGDPRIFSI